MNDQAIIEKIVREILASINEGGGPVVQSGQRGRSGQDGGYAPGAPGGKLTRADYPLASKKPELVKTNTGKSMREITLEAVVSGEIQSPDIKISPETLEIQAQIAESAGRSAFARNLRRAAELTRVPDERILEIYNALRPFRSTKKQLLDIADELDGKFGAKISGAFVREAAEVYEQRNRLKAE